MSFCIHVHVAPNDYEKIDAEWTFTPTGEDHRICLEIDLVCNATTVRHRDEKFYINISALTPGAYSQFSVNVTVAIMGDSDGSGNEPTLPTFPPTQPTRPTGPTRPTHPTLPPTQPTPPVTTGDYCKVVSTDTDFRYQ